MAPKRLQLNYNAHIRLEASSACQLRCPSCPTTTGHTEQVVGKSVLRLADFVALVDANPWIGRIELSNYGEVFLNPDLLAIFAHAYRRNVTLAIANGANLNHVRDEVLEALVRYQIDFITCSIDGASQETYVRYRKRGNFDRVIANIRRINAFKASYRSARPRLRWQFVAFGYNEHEIPAARALAAELGMEFGVKLSWDPDFSPVQDAEAVRAASGTGAATRAEFEQNTGKDYAAATCEQLWNAPQVNWDGKVLGCCRNFWGEFGGNAFRDGLIDSLNHDRMEHARAMLSGKAEPRADIPCSTCDIYLRRRESADWVLKPAAVPSSAFAAAASELSRRALALRQAGNRPHAGAWARVLLQVQPGNPLALELLAEDAEAAGRSEAAAYYRRQAAATELAPA
jgi:MoaA/NifB/PqqE/SkfB family radical SAM enzyme